MAHPNPMSCKDIVELLPWLLNGSLDRAERRHLLDHLAVCESCRIELEEAAQVWELSTQHIDALDLVEYAQGLPLTAKERERIKRHLIFCPSCRQERDWAMADRVVAFETVSKTPPSQERRLSGFVFPGARWLRLTLAASVLAALLSGGLVWSIHRLDSPTAMNVAEIESTAIQHNEHRTLSSAEQKRRQGGDDVLASLFTDGFESGSMIAWSSESH